MQSTSYNLFTRFRVEGLCCVMGPLTNKMAPFYKTCRFTTENILWSEMDLTKPICANIFSFVWNKMPYYDNHYGRCFIFIQLCRNPIYSYINTNFEINHFTLFIIIPTLIISKVISIISFIIL